MKRATIRLIAALFWLAAAVVWLVFALLNSFEPVYLLACGVSILAGSVTLVIRHREQTTGSGSKSGRKPK